METQNESKLSWQDHVEAASLFAGSQAAYCRKNGIDPATYYAQKCKLGFSKKRESIKSDFVRVETKGLDNPRSRRRLPDPRWVADFILELDRSE